MEIVYNQDYKLKAHGSYCSPEKPAPSDNKIKQNYDYTS